MVCAMLGHILQVKENLLQLAFLTQKKKHSASCSGGSIFCTTPIHWHEVIEVCLVEVEPRGRKSSAVDLDLGYEGSSSVAWATWPGHVYGTRSTDGSKRKKNKQKNQTNNCVVFMGITNRKISTWTPRTLKLGHFISSREVLYTPLSKQCLAYCWTLV